MRRGRGLAAASVVAATLCCLGGCGRSEPKATAPALPLETASPLPINEERFDCAAAGPMTIRFQAMPDLATIEVAGETYRLPIAVSGSGYRYADATTELAGKGDEVRLMRTGRPDLECTRALAPPQ